MKSRVNREHIIQIIWLFIILCIGVFMLLPIFRNGFLVTDDGNWMVIRLSAFYQSLRSGQFPVRFLSRLNYSYGYPVSNFLYPGFLYIGSFVHALGFSFQSTVEIIIVGYIFFGAIALYGWLRCFFDIRSSAIGAMSFLLCPYVLYDIFKRGSVGEIAAMCTCMFCLYIIEKRKYWLLSPVLGLLLISHNSLALFFLPFLIGYGLVRWKKEPLESILLGIGYSAFFWIPVFYEKGYVLFDSIAISDPSHYFVISNTLILQSLPFLIIAALSILLKNGKIEKVHWYFLFLLLVVVFLASGLSEGVWHLQILRQAVQFPYRFLAFFSFIGPWFIASFANEKRLYIGTILSIFTVCLFLYISLPYQQGQSIVRPEGYFTTNEDTTTVANEYMPKWVRKFPVARAQKNVEIFKGNATIDDHSISPEKINITIHAQEQTELQLNKIYYPGWGAVIDDNPVTISYDNEYGLMRLSVPKGDHRIYMAFRETKSRFIADLLTIICFLIWFTRFIILPVAYPKYVFRHQRPT